MRASHISSSEEARVGEGPLSKEWRGPEKNQIPDRIEIYGEF